MLMLWLKAVTVFYFVATLTSQKHGSGQNSLSRGCLVIGKTSKITSYIILIISSWHVFIPGDRTKIKKYIKKRVVIKTDNLSKYFLY